MIHQKTTQQDLFPRNGSLYKKPIMPKISVILPVYNASAFLKKAIDSIILQTYTDWELIVINDGSTDNSEEIILSYTDKRIKYYNNETNLGLITSLNKAILLCSGEYIARMDADDISLPERFTKQINFLDKNRDYAMCGSFAQIIDSLDNITGKIIHVTDNDYLKVNLLFSVPFVHPSMMIRSDIFNEALFDKEYLHAEDYDLWTRISKNHKVANIPDFLLKYRWHTTNVSVTNSKKQEEIKDKIIIRELNFLGLTPNNEELYLHKISFAQFDIKNQTEQKKFDKFDKLEIWFLKIIKANRERQLYDNNALIQFLWSRWIIVCIVQKKFGKICKPKFVTYSIPIWIKTFQLMVFLSKKK